jgi:hypothetical protein
MSTYSTRLKIELIGSGEQSNSWGNTTNNNFSQSIEQSIAGVYTKNLGSSSSPVTLTTNNIHRSFIRFYYTVSSCRKTILFKKR